MADVDFVDILSPGILLLITATLSIMFLVKRRQTRVNALDWLVGIFGGVSVMGLFEILKRFFLEDWGLFRYASDIHSLASDPVRLMHALVLIALYLMAEQFLGDNINNLRLMTMTSLFTIYIGLTIYFINSGVLLYMDDFIGFAQHTTFDAFIFDTIQMFSITVFSYAYVQQYMISEDKKIRNNLLFLLIALMIYYVTALIEIIEHFVEIADLNAFMMAIPSFLLLAFFYIRNPNFVYMAPTRIGFLQIVSENGELLYAVELTEALEAEDFLVAPSLTSVSFIIGELTGEEQVRMKKFEYVGGNIIVENGEHTRVILQTTRPSNILRRAMRYLLRVFVSEFGEQYAQRYKGYIEESKEGVTPDDVIRQCIPIIQSKVLTSSYSESKAE